MGAWGHGPLEADDASDVIGAVRYVLDHGWQALREDELDDAGMALAEEAAAITRSLVRAGINAQPSDHDELVDAWDELPAVVVEALATERPHTRPGFPDECGVERWLREGGAPYEVWMGAAAYGDDRVAAWNACSDAATLLTMARLAGVGDNSLVDALATCTHSLVTGSDDNATVLREVLARVAALQKPDPLTLERFEAIETRGGDLLTAIVTTASDLMQGGIRLGLVRLHRLAAAVPDLGMRLRPLLDPLIAGRL